MKKKIFLALAFCLFLGTSKVSAATVKSYFPDEKLFTCLATSKSIDETTDESEFDFNSVVSLNCNSGVSDATGIEKLTGLVSLNLDKGSLTTIDLSKNESLQILSLAENKLSNIDLSKNTELKDLTLSSNEFTTVDLSKNTALTNVNLINNQITSIDLSKNTALNVLNISKNKLFDIDLSKNTALSTLIINSNPLLDKVELALDEEFDYTDYIKLPDNFTATYTPEKKVVKESGDKLVAIKVGTENAELAITNDSAGTSTKFTSVITVSDQKGEETTEEKKTSETTENPKTGIYGGSIALIAIAAGAYAFMSNKNKYNSVR